MTKQEETKKNTIEEAKAQVYSMIQQGINYREIAQTEFLVNERTKKFSISEISKIKKELEPKSSQQKLDPDKAEAFRLFGRGYSPSKVLTETKFTFEYVKQAYEEFLEFERKTIIPDWFFQRIVNLVRSMNKNCNSYKEIGTQIEIAVKSHFQLKSFTYPCNVCGGPLQLDKVEWSSVKKFLIDHKWAHISCREK